MSTDDAYIPSDPPQSEPKDAAERLGRYKTGADGSIRDGLLDRAVVLRSVSSVEADDLQNEARFYARLHHPGLPCVIDFVRDDAGAALVMTQVVGLTLAAAVTARSSGQVITAIASPTACTLSFITMCDALGAAHLRGVVHGAIAPDIVILGDDGQIIIEGWTKALKMAQRPLTTRFCSHVPAPVELAADGLHQDIRGLGVCLFTALVGEAPPLTNDGQLAVLEPTSAARLPRPLLTIIRKALASNATEGYSSIATLRADLVSFLAGQESPSETPDLSSLRRMAMAALIALLVAGAIIALNWRSVSTYATWGPPMVVEDFANDGWKSRWGARGQWQQHDGRIVSATEYDCALILKQRLSPPVAIEYTGRFSPGNAGDLSIWWCEDDAFALRPYEDIDNAHAWYVQAGAYANSWCTIWQTPARLRAQVNNLILEPDRDYRFRVEIETDQLAMWIDGKKVLEHHELFPIGSGTIALYTWDPGKSFSDVRVWQKAMPALVSPLAIGDEALRAGRIADAVTAYARVAASHRGLPLGAEALYFQGLALHRQGSHAIAHKVWKELPEGLLRQRADCLVVDDMLAQGDLGSAVSHFTAMWHEHPDVHDVLRQRWQVCGQAMRSAHPVRPAEIKEWIKLRDATFADDQASRWLVAELLNVTGRWEETIRRFPDERRAVAPAMIALGRNAEVIAADWSIPAERLRARLGLGDVEGVLQAPDLDRHTRIDLLCKTGRATEAAAMDPYPAQIYLGNIDGLLSQNSLGSRANVALIGAGRLEEAAGAGVPGSPQSGRNPDALLLLGRLDKAEQLGANTHLHHLLSRLCAGEFDEARALRPGVILNRNRGPYSGWFGQGPGIALIDTVLGDVSALHKALEDGARIPNGWGGRCALVCSAALDPAKDAAVSAMPWRTEAIAWLHVARALRAELAGDHASALAAWRSYKALPMVERLLEGHSPSIELEAIADWRITVLGQAP